MLESVRLRRLGLNPGSRVSPAYSECGLGSALRTVNAAAFAPLDGGGGEWIKFKMAYGTGIARLSRTRWIAIVAIVGVLLHAVALVRHHAGMLTAELGRQTLITDLRIVCHGTDGQQALADTEAPQLPPARSAAP